MQSVWKHRGLTTLRWLEHGLAVFGLGVILWLVAFDLQVMEDSPSMSPTLCGPDKVAGTPGDLIIAEKLTYRFRTPRRWELVSFYNPESFCMITKRVVGLPGENISVKKFALKIDGQPIPIPRSLSGLRYYSYGNLFNGRPASCGNGYYVLGDYSRDSDDSRFNGPVTADRIRCRPWLRIWPLSRFGLLTSWK